METKFLEWTVTFAASIFLAQFAILIYRLASAPQVRADRRIAMRRIAIGIGFFLLLTLAGVYYRGPIHLSPTTHAYFTAPLLLVIANLLLGSWLNVLMFSQRTRAVPKKLFPRS